MFESIVQRMTRRTRTVLIIAGCAAAAITVLVVALRPTGRITVDAGPCGPRDLAALVTLKGELSLGLPVWMNMWQRLDPDFSIDEFKCLDVEGLGSLPAAAPAGAKFDRMTIPSPDRKRGIDLYSYHWDLSMEKGEVKAEVLEPDTEVVLLDPARNARTRILFLGTDAGVDDAVWMDDATIAIVGYQDAWEGGRPGRTREPLLWIIRLDAGTVSLFGGRAAAGYDPGEYVSRKFALTKEGP